ncbi:hypothetical protein [Amycolatopsis sp. cmx-4-83]|uniref:hypothetical protein n=1 Tax=Amycolatopsis sp. cmx-4-83 TaxID=2790940 RepID=UPI00397D4942
MRSSASAREGDGVERVLVLGCGGAGKPLFARRLGVVTGLPVGRAGAGHGVLAAGPVGPARAEWVTRQRELIAAPRRIEDGDLGPYDVLEVRLAADTAVVLNPSPARCARRALRRGRERWDFWRWRHPRNCGGRCRRPMWTSSSCARPARWQLF